MKKLLIGLIILAVIATVTNPSEQTHKDAVKKELKSELDFSGIAEELNLGSFLINNLIIRENHYVYSITKLKIMGEEKVVGYGAFGMVFINRDALTN